MLALRNGLSLAAVAAVALSVLVSPAGAQEEPPTTGFEDRNGASWTTHGEELAFLTAVDEMSDRVEISEIGATRLGRPLHLVRVGHPTPATVEEAQTRPTTAFVCSQHGNEPAGREACLIALRDLAFTEDQNLIDLMASQAFLFVPTANPDGRASNSRGNSRGTDINRDHINLETEEAQAIAAVVRDWTPDLSVDLHEYGPSLPVVYDDEVLYMWPRNLNVERGVQGLARSFALDKIEPCSEGAGYTADEYGIYAAGDVDVTQTAGGPDEGIMRNAMGLRHSLGILIETSVSADATNNAGEEVLSSSANLRRRVAGHRQVIECTFEWLVDNGGQMLGVTSTAPLRKHGEGLALNVPVFFGGADNEAPSASDEIYPPDACAYDLTAGQLDDVRTALELHGIGWYPLENGTFRVPLSQPAEPLIPLLLDARGDRNAVSATRFLAPPLDPACDFPKEDEEGSGASSAAIPAALLGGLALGAVELRRRRLATAAEDPR